jgi:hypothetical protein
MVAFAVDYGASAMHTGCVSMSISRRVFVTSTAGGAAAGLAGRFGFQPGMVVQELGWDDDIDDDIRSAIESITGSEMVDGDHGDVVDAVVLWWRAEDGDLVDGLVDSLTDLVEGGVIWLLTPKVGRPNYVDAHDVAEAAPTAGLSTTTSFSAGLDWSATKLVGPRSGGRSPRR